MKQIKSIDDLTPDEENINQRTKRSYMELWDSQEFCGWGRDIVVDKNGVIIAGHGNVEVLADRYGSSVPEPIIVQTDGSRPIVHQRTDLDLHDDNDERARALSYYDNATTRHGQWNRDNVALAQQRGRNLARIFTDEELVELTRDQQHTQPHREDPKPRKQVFALSVTCKDEQDLQELQQYLIGRGYDVKTVVRGA